MGPITVWVSMLKLGTPLISETMPLKPCRDHARALAREVIVDFLALLFTAIDLAIYSRSFKVRRVDVMIVRQQ